MNTLDCLNIRKEYRKGNKGKGIKKKKINKKIGKKKGKEEGKRNKEKEKELEKMETKKKRE